MVLLGAVTVLLTEALGPFHLLRRAPLAIAWIGVALAASGFAYRRRAALAAMWPGVARPNFETAIAAIATSFAAGIAGIVALIAVISPPNSADAMAYHLPRVVYWAQSGSVAFFPTPYFNQITLQPLAEYIMLHTYVLSGGDHFINLVACAAFVGSMVGVSAIALVALLVGWLNHPTR